MSEEKERVQLVCSKCGSTKILLDAWAGWNPNRQQAELVTTFDKGHYCEDCDGECSVKEIPLEDGEYPYPVEAVLDKKWSECERGNIALHRDDGSTAFYLLVGGDPDGKMTLLFIQNDNANYPSLYTCIRHLTAEELANELIDDHPYWVVDKLNLVPEDSVPLAGNCIMSREEIAEEEE